MSSSQPEHSARKRPGERREPSRRPYVLVENGPSRNRRRRDDGGSQEAFVPVPGQTVAESIARVSGLSREGLLAANAELKNRLDDALARLQATERSLVELEDAHFKVEAALNRSRLKLLERDATIAELETTLKVLLDEPPGDP